MGCILISVLAGRSTIQNMFIVVLKLVSYEEAELF